MRSDLSFDSLPVRAARNLAFSKSDHDSTLFPKCSMSSEIVPLNQPSFVISAISRPCLPGRLIRGLVDLGAALLFFNKDVEYSFHGGPADPVSPPGLP